MISFGDQLRPRTLLPALAFTWAELFVLETLPHCQRALNIQHQSVGHNIKVTLRLPKLVVRAGGVLVCCTTPNQQCDQCNTRTVCRQQLRNVQKLQTYSQSFCFLRQELTQILHKSYRFYGLHRMASIW